MPTAEVGPVNPLPPLFSAADLHAVVDPGEADAEMRRNIGYGRVRSVLPYLRPGRLRPRPPAGRAQGRRAGERRPAGHLPPRPRRSAVVPGAQAHRSRAAATGTRSSSRRTSPCATPGSPAASSGTSGPSGTPPRRASRCTRPGCCSRTARRCCGCTSSSGCARSCSRSTPGCPRARPCCWSTSGSSTPTTSRPRCTGGPTSRCPRRTTYASSPLRTRPGSSPATSPLRRVPMPVLDGLDRTYTTRASEAADYFFAIDDDQRRWVTALDGRGSGTGADLHRPAPRPQAVPVGEEPGRRPLAGVARAARSGVPRDPGRPGPDPAGAPAHAGTGSRGHGSRRTDCSRATRTPCTATTGPWRERPCRVTWRSWSLGPSSTGR